MVVVTGGTGLLGSHLLYYLTKDGGEKSIRASYRCEKRKAQVKKLFFMLGGDSGIENYNKIEWILSDLTVPYDVHLLLVNATKVYHCAALVSFFSSDFSKLLKQNKEITASIVNACLERPNTRLCYVSSTAAIGNSVDGLTDENTKWEMNKRTSAYSISKYLAEKEVWRGIEEGLNAVIINPCVILGAGNWNDSSLSILKSASKGMPFYTPGSNSIVDARDVVQCMIQLMNSTLCSERFLCTGDNVKFSELFTELSNQMGRKSPKYRIPYPLAISFAFLNERLQFFRSKKRGLSRDTVKSSFKSISYSRKKLESVVECKFHSLEETINFSIKNRIV